MELETETQAVGVVVFKPRTIGNFPDLITIPVTIKNRPLMAIIDPVSQVSMVGREIASGAPFSESTTELRDHLNAGVRHQGIAQVTAVIGGRRPITFDCYVLAKPTCPLVLGVDFLRTFEVDLLFSQSTVTSRHFGNAKMLNTHTKKEVKTTEDVTSTTAPRQ